LETVVLHNVNLDSRPLNSSVWENDGFEKANATQISKTLGKPEVRINFNYQEIQISRIIEILNGNYVHLYVPIYKYIYICMYRISYLLRTDQLSINRVLDGKKIG
jgi:hypothetical protein